MRIRAPWPSRQAVAHLERKVHTMSANQEKLDAAVTALTEDVETIKTELADAAANGKPLDFSRLDALVAAVDAVAHPPVEPTPEPAPEEPSPF